MTIRAATIRHNGIPPPYRIVGFHPSFQFRRISPGGASLRFFMGHERDIAAPLPVGKKRIQPQIHCVGDNPIAQDCFAASCVEEESCDAFCSDCGLAAA